MKYKKTTFKALIALSFILILFSLGAVAQPQNPPDPQDTPVPITGIEYLLISGGLLGGYKLLKKRINKV